jgi:ribosomal-protein-alanine N-acetyltransferase
MSLPPFLTPGPDFTAYRPTVGGPLPEVFARLAAALSWARGAGVTRFLVDARRIPGIESLNTFERFELGERAAAAAGPGMTVAFVAPAHLLDPGRLGVMVASNRGVRSSAFTDEVAALEWLVGPHAVRPVLTTERLEFRWLLLRDSPFILELLTQPSWLRFIGDRGVKDLATAEGYIANGPRASYRERGYGLWHMKDRASGEGVGMCGLLRRPGFEHPEIGFALLERHQRKGYGREAARATMEHARTALGLGTLWAVVDPENAGSISILEGGGFSYLRPITMPGETKAISLYQSVPLP